MKTKKAQRCRLLKQREGYRRILGGQEWDFQFAIANDCKTVALANGSNRVEIVRIGDDPLRELISVQELATRIDLASGERVDGLQFSADDHSVIVASEENVQAYAVDSGWLRNNFECPPRSKLVCLTSELVIENLKNEEVIRRISIPRSSAYSMVFSEDGARIALGAGYPHVWETDSGKLLLEAQLGSPHTLMFTPDGNQLVAGDRGNGIHVWDLATGKLLATLPGHRRYVTAIAIAPGGKTFASGCIDSEILIWDATRLPPVTEPPVD